MKNLFIISLVLLCSCQLVKVSTVASDDVPLKSSHFVYENDTVKITYHFWAERGVMDFDIYNKMGTTIYFDWKNSAFIPNEQMVSYWQDVTNTTGVSSTATSWLYGGAISTTSGAAKSVHQERIGVIPPHSMISRFDYKLVKKNSDVPLQGDYNIDNSYLKFRNYLMFCTNEKFDSKICTVDNEFYVSNIKEVHFSKISDFKKPYCFYSRTN